MRDDDFPYPYTPDRYPYWLVRVAWSDELQLARLGAVLNGQRMAWIWCDLRHVWTGPLAILCRVDQYDANERQVAQAERQIGVSE